MHTCLMNAWRGCQLDHLFPLLNTQPRTVMLHAAAHLASQCPLAFTCFVVHMCLLVTRKLSSIHPCMHGCTCALGVRKKKCFVCIRVEPLREGAECKENSAPYLALNIDGNPLCCSLCQHASVETSVRAQYGYVNQWRRTFVFSGPLLK